MLRYRGDVPALRAKHCNDNNANPVVRLLYVVVSLLVQNARRYLQWEYVATPRRGGRHLWSWSFKEFIKMLCQAAWTALAVRRAVPANRPPDDRFHR